MMIRDYDMVMMKGDGGTEEEDFWRGRMMVVDRVVVPPGHASSE